MDLKERVREVFELMLQSETSDGKQKADAAFAALNAELDIEQRKEAGRLMREIMAERRAERARKRTDINVRQQLENVIEIVPLAYIAKHYFNKDRSWLYQRVNGSIVNGKPAAFTQEELFRLADALKEIGNKINHAALSIH